MGRTKYSVVIPVYKSTKSLPELERRIDEVFSTLPGSDYEIIFVNDSPFFKDTTEALRAVLERNPKVIVIELMKNYGQQAATLCGIEYARGDFVITMDDDLQHDPEDIPKLLRMSDHDVVIASFSAKKHKLHQKLGSAVKGYFDHKILGKPKSIRMTSFRCIKAEIAKLMFRRKTPYPFIPALLFEITDDVLNVDLEHHPRHEGASHYTIGKMLGVFSNLLINNSSLLLRMIGYMGLVIAAAALVLAITLVARKLLLGYIIAGWTSTVVMILFFGGMILLTLGIIGEYLIRIIATTEDRPIYHARHIYDHSQP